MCLVTVPNNLLRECKKNIKNFPKDPQAILDILSVWNDEDDYDYDENDMEYMQSYYRVIFNACFYGCYDVVNALSKVPNPLDGKFMDIHCLSFVVEKNDEKILNLLLNWPINAPRADHNNGSAFCYAAFNGHIEMVRLLLEWPKNAPRADCQDGEALCSAASNGQIEMVRFLLELPENAPRADCQDGEALCNAAQNGHNEVVRLLLEWPENAPHADCQNGKALIKAVEADHIETVKLLLEWPTNAPRADCQNNRAFVAASNNKAFVAASYSGNYEMLRLLLNSLNAL